MDAPQSQEQTDIFEDTKLFFKFLLLIISFLSRPSEIFLRYRFGERYFSLFPVIATALVINIVFIFLAAKSPISGEEFTSTGLLLFSYLFIALSLYHRFVIIKGEFKGDYEVYSYQSGHSLPFWYQIFKHDGILNRLFPSFVNRVAEPALVFIIGSILIIFDTSLGVFLQISAVCFFIQESVHYRYRRIHYLDMKDAKILAKYNADIELEFNQKKPNSGEVVQQVSSI